MDHYPAFCPRTTLVPRFGKGFCTNAAALSPCPSPLPACRRKPPRRSEAEPATACGAHEDRPDALGDETRDTGPPSRILLGSCINSINRQHSKPVLLRRVSAKHFPSSALDRDRPRFGRNPSLAERVWVVIRCPGMSHSDLRARLSEVASNPSRAYVGRST